MKLLICLTIALTALSVAAAPFLRSPVDLQERGTANVVRLIWKCTKPRNTAVVQLTEALMTKAALKYKMDTAIIRKEPHDTTKVGGKYVKTVPHITGDIVNTKVNEGFAIHYNLDTKNNPLADSPPKAPNPEVWPLKHKSGKGFILVEADGTEIDMKNL